MLYKIKTPVAPRMTFNTQKFKNTAGVFYAMYILTYPNRFFNLNLYNIYKKDLKNLREIEMERAAGIEPVSQAWKAWVITIIRCPRHEACRMT